MKKYISIAMCGLLCFTAFAACGGNASAPSPAPAPDPAPEPAPAEPPKPIDQIPDTIRGTITMDDGGTIVFELYPNIAPQSVFNFIALARDGFYDGLKFHRIMSGFMIQGGCPDGTGSGNPGYGILGEFAKNGIENNLHHERGVMSMARQGDPAFNSAGSQFFIVHGDALFLDGGYAGFGKVTSGMDVVDKIAETPVTDNNGGVRSADMPVIKSVTIDDDIVLPLPEKLSR